jgi:dUTP pyrophosphatase
MQSKQEKKMETLRVVKLDPTAKLPTRGSDESAGYDLYSLTYASILPRSHAVVSTGIAISMPNIPGFKTVGLIKSRSGFSAKKGMEHGAGVIDADYTGPIGVVLHNHSNEEIKLEKHTRIAQLLIMPVVTPDVEEVKAIEKTERGCGGFGSTGK